MRASWPEIAGQAVGPTSTCSRKFPCVVLGVPTVGGRGCALRGRYGAIEVPHRGFSGLSKNISMALRTLQQESKGGDGRVMLRGLQSCI